MGRKQASQIYLESLCHMLTAPRTNLRMGRGQVNTGGSIWGVEPWATWRRAGTKLLRVQGTTICLREEAWDTAVAVLGEVGLNENGAKSGQRRHVSSKHREGAHWQLGWYVIGPGLRLTRTFSWMSRPGSSTCDCFEKCQNLRFCKLHSLKPLSAGFCTEWRKRQC